MFIGHYGVSYAIRRWRPDVSMLAAFIAVQLLDVAWSVFIFAGIEKVRIVPGITQTNSLDLYFMPYTHSLVAAVVWAVVGAGLYSMHGRKAIAASVAVGAAVFSHWLLDLVVHIRDLPLYDNTAKVGLGLWNYRYPAFVLEIALVVAGIVVYLRGSRAVDRIGRIGPWLFVVLLIAVQAGVFFGGAASSPTAAAVIALVSYAGFAAIAEWLDHHRAAQVTPGRRAPVLRESGAAAAPRP
jgi:hypothetical protein